VATATADLPTAEETTREADSTSSVSSRLLGLNQSGWALTPAVGRSGPRPALPEESTAARRPRSSSASGAELAGGPGRGGMRRKAGLPVRIPRA
jgi:hypothetical protein